MPFVVVATRNEEKKHATARDDKKKKKHQQHNTAHCIIDAALSSNRDPLFFGCTTCRSHLDVSEQIPRDDEIDSEHQDKPYVSVLRSTYIPNDKSRKKEQRNGRTRARK